MSKQQPFDNAPAFREGWALFNDGDLQRLDCPADSGFHESDEPVFGSDRDAFCYVWRMAVSGSAYHCKALSLTRYVGTNPQFS